MKRVGIFVLLVGLSFTLITTLGLMVNEKRLAERIDVTTTKIGPRVWEPMVGTILVVAGTCMYKVGKKAEAKNRIEFRNTAKLV